MPSKILALPAFRSLNAAIMAPEPLLTEDAFRPSTPADCFGLLFESVEIAFTSRLLLPRALRSRHHLEFTVLQTEGPQSKCCCILENLRIMETCMFSNVFVLDFSDVSSAVKRLRIYSCCEGVVFSTIATIVLGSGWKANATAAKLM